MTCRLVGKMNVMWICAVVIGLAAVISEARILDQPYYKNNDLPPQYIQDLQEEPWDILNPFGYYDDLPPQDDEWSDWNDDVIVPAQLRDNPNWPSNQTRPKIGQVGGIAMDTDGNLVVFHRADRIWNATSFGLFNRFNTALGTIKSDVITTVNPKTGDILSQSGSGQFYMPHGLTIDKDGNKWLTDVGLHQVMRIPKDSDSPDLVLGKRLVPGSDERHFCKPTDVAVASNGDFFVADGYCNGRIMKFSDDETLQTQWGQRFTGSDNPKIDQFNIPHSLALDESRDLICVADRENGRILCFDAGLKGTTAGTFNRSFEPQRGTIYAIEYDPNADVLYVVNGPGMGVIEGFTLDMDGNVLEMWRPENSGFGQPHDVTVSKDGSDVFVGDIGKLRKLWMFTRFYMPQPIVG